MNKFFYSKLAVTNIKNNRTIYFPYVLASVLIVSLFYSLRAVAIMVLASNSSGSGTMSGILILSSYICGLLSLIIIFYINSFIMKRRKKEFGLFSVLGMEKKHISIVMLFEVLITGISSIFIGILCGILFSQLSFLVLFKIIGLPMALSFQVPAKAVIVTLALFGICFAIVLIIDIIKVLRTDPIALLNSSNEGEKEPRAKWILALIGVCVLGVGYVLSWMVKTPSDALTAFFPATILVIIGTYLLFIAGSIAFLKLLKSNKSFYYKSKNFISVSGMIYRMKQNAAGLATICILSTCVLVTLSSTVCLFLGEEDILQNQFPRQIEFTSIADASSDKIVPDAAKRHAQKYNFKIENDIGYASISMAANRNKNTFIASELYNSDTYEVECITINDYNKITGADYQLEKGEGLICMNGDPISGNTFQLGNKTLIIKGTIPTPDFVSLIGMNHSLVIALSDFSELEALQNYLNNRTDQSYSHNIMYSYRYDVSGDKENLPQFYSTMRENFNQSVPHVAVVRNIDSSRTDFYQVYGSILFVGIFFVTLFLIAAVLIIYYKQVTEGFDDSCRFRIMKNVGMSKQEIKGTIRKQVLMVFFLPLIVAVIHLVVAFPVLCKLLTVFNMVNTHLFMLCCAGSVLSFAILYFVVYSLTAAVYYRIVQA